MTELDFTDGAVRLTLRGNAGGAEAGGVEAAVSAPERKPDAPGAPSVHLTMPVEKAAADSTGSECITSPIVGVFYASSEPDAPPFVRAGTTVKAGQILCVLEAMKMMNRLEAEFDCEILAVKASNGDMVEYGQALFEVKRLQGAC
jgi:acetyl-CoA carboxylase biotin carboxyl carrier protein